ncbi:hypothetical protein SDC9_75496 [bioreactor metagenome]|uniref:Uncharacterized protein n=1 Tax=bioreactor metagenome TaxID=1076179 RepID=A0A644YLT5_9ZZZZ
MLQPLHERHGEVVRPQGGKGQGDPVGLAPLQKAVAEGIERAVVAGGEGSESHLLVAGGLASLHALAAKHVGVLGAHRAVHIARLTEAAAADTAAEDLQHHPVVYDLGRGDDGGHGVIGGIEILNHALGDNRRGPVPGSDGGYRTVHFIGNVVEGGDVETLDPRG